jgi:hypothetical protein
VLRALLTEVPVRTPPSPWPKVFYRLHGRGHGSIAERDKSPPCIPVRTPPSHPMFQPLYGGCDGKRYPALHPGVHTVICQYQVFQHLYGGGDSEDGPLRRADPRPASGCAHR